MIKIGRAELHNCDCMELLSKYPDKHFELAIVDPPYGMGLHHQNNKQIAGTKGYSYGSSLKMKEWDIAPAQTYFDELFRVSKKQIICGGNYFQLPTMRNFIIYHKRNIPEGFNMAQCEYLWTNIEGNSKIYSYMAKPDSDRFHPCQKPIELYKWLIANYANNGDKILDTHMGSGTIAVACNELNFDLVASEIDTDYFNLACNRIREAYSQGDLFREAG